MNGEWHNSQNGNYALIKSGELSGTVFPNRDDLWCGVSNDTFLKQKYRQPEEAMSALEAAIAAGAGSELWADKQDTWRASKPRTGRDRQNNKVALRGYWRKENSSMLSVRETTSGSWTATWNQTVVVEAADKPIWFASAEDAMSHVDKMARAKKRDMGR